MGTCYHEAPSAGGKLTQPLFALPAPVFYLALLLSLAVGMGITLLGEKNHSAQIDRRRGHPDCSDDPAAGAGHRAAM